MNEELMLIVTAVFVVVIYAGALAVAVANYVMCSLSYYAIAKRRNIDNPWLAWIPVASYWLLGAIADEFDARNGIKRNWGKTLIILAALFVGGFVLIFVGAFVFIIVNSLAAGNGYMHDTEATAGFFIVYCVAVTALSLSALALQALQYICVYKVFESTVPKKSLKYMLLYLIVPFAGGICLLKCKDKGYPTYEYAASVSAAMAAAEDIEENTENTEE